ncbi:MAG: zinc-dependent metalloprotease [Propionibacterium sp.]|nr:zinc-dependent metalloprotease [Propionibacterium sp.]
MTEPGGFNFEELRKMLQQMGIVGDEGELDLGALMERMQKMQAGGRMFGMTPADQDPDAAWLTTITAAKQATVAEGPDPELLPHERAAVVDAERIAQSWLNEFTTFAEPEVPARTVTRTGWLDETSAAWRAIVEPIIDGLGDALERSSTEGATEGMPEGVDLGAMMGPLMRTSASLTYRDRLRRELSKVARDTLTGTEIGFNLFEGTEVVVVPANVAQFTQDLEADDTDMMLVLLVREAARQRLFRHVGWLSPQLLALMSHYAREITIDLDAITERLNPESLQNMSMEDMVRMGEEVQVSFFRPASTEKQLGILDRLGVLLALVEGWVDHVSARVMEKWMPHAPQLSEVLRRRRAAGSPVRSVLRELIGLDLAPRMVRDAENLWAAIEHHGDIASRDQVWRHPDMVPTAKDLEDPLAFISRADDPPTDDLDEQLRRLLGP